ncbi:MAG: signal recognition particle protein [Planctomycetes bacterium]|nr:signal recognition particle protein [Planctomycetota bacterium]
MFESLTESLGNVFRKLAGRGRLTEKNIEEGLREVRTALLAADVNYKVVKEFIDRVTKKAVGQDVIKTIRPAEQIVKIVHDELCELMGPVDHDIPWAPKGPTVIMMVGLQGSGKTTTTGKLAKHLQKRGKKPLLVAADMIRPAAVEQLKTLGAANDIPVYAEAAGRPVKICDRGIKHAEEKGHDVVVLDTQGRLHIDQEMMNELKEIKEKVKPHQIYFVIDGASGQDAVNSARQFNDTLSVDGIIVTKLDGDARAGATLSCKAVTGKPIKFLGVGEKMENLEEFHPERMAGRILGMGDVVSLVEKAQEAIDQEQAAKFRDKIKKDELNLADFLAQLQQMKKMGPIKGLMKMLPGPLADMAGEIDENEVKHAEAIIQSMTPQERESPEILSGGRKQRIAKGCGRPVQEVNSLLKQFDDARKMLRQLKKGKGGLGALFQGFGR